MMQELSKPQQGYTLIALIFMLGIFYFFALLIIKICHIYLDYSKVKDALVSVEKTVDIQTLSEAEVRPTLSKRFDLNYAKHATLQDVKITKRGSYLKVGIEYDVVEKIAGNLSVLVEFYDFFEVSKEW
ncbi:MAG: DUF4845 domain-containing protein [Proteobacteria bacterium]|nr:DUF4845 domain-containing protein [Pseudomonadota bacterium]